MLNRHPHDTNSAFFGAWRRPTDLALDWLDDEFTAGDDALLRHVERHGSIGIEPIDLDAE